MPLKDIHSISKCKIKYVLLETKKLMEYWFSSVMYEHS